MISAQFLGAFLGVLLGYLAIIDKTDQNKFYDYSIPRGWVGVIAPKMPNDRPDEGQDSEHGFMRDWQTFWAMLLTSIVLVLCYCSIKNEATKISEHVIVQILIFVYIFVGINAINIKFGAAGINPALASAYIALETSQTKDEEAVNHYLWAYMIAPLVGGSIGGFLSIIH